MDPREKIARAIYEAGKQELSSSPAAKAEYARKVDKMTEKAYSRGVERSVERQRQQRQGLNLRPYLK